MKIQRFLPRYPPPHTPFPPPSPPHAPATLETSSASWRGWRVLVTRQRRVYWDFRASTYLYILCERIFRVRTVYYTYTHLRAYVYYVREIHAFLTRRDSSGVTRGVRRTHLLSNLSKWAFPELHRTPTRTGYSNDIRAVALCSS